MRIARRIAIVLLSAGPGFGLAAERAPSAPSRQLAATATPAAGMFLIARRDLPDPNFFRSVVLLTEHGAGGSLGLIVNRRTRSKLADVLPEITPPPGTSHALYFGGPVARVHIAMLIRNAQPGENITRVTEEIAFSADRTVLESLLARNKPASELRLYAGHAGWGPGQLGFELARRDWHVVKADAQSVFGGNEEGLWDRLIRKVEPGGLVVRAEHGTTVAGQGGTRRMPRLSGSVVHGALDGAALP
jgi:putative transcriptional regulator